MVLKNEQGREIEISFFGTYEDIQVEEVWYLDSEEDEVSEEDIEYIKDTYAFEIEEVLNEQQIGMSYAWKR